MAFNKTITLALLLIGLTDSRAQIPLNQYPQSDLDLYLATDQRYKMVQMNALQGGSDKTTEYRNAVIDYQKRNRYLPPQDSREYFLLMQNGTQPQPFNPFGPPRTIQMPGFPQPPGFTNYQTPGFPANNSVNSVNPPGGLQPLASKSSKKDFVSSAQEKAADLWQEMKRSACKTLLGKIKNDIQDNRVNNLCGIAEKAFDSTERWNKLSYDNQVARMRMIIECTDLLNEKFDDVKSSEVDFKKPNANNSHAE